MSEQLKFCGALIKEFFTKKHAVSILLFKDFRFWSMKTFLLKLRKLESSKKTLDSYRKEKEQVPLFYTKLAFSLQS